MNPRKPSSVALAVRVYPEPLLKDEKAKTRKKLGSPRKHDRLRYRDHG